MPAPARLYILMRTDMDYSMTPGRKMAQASHAANQAQTKLLKDYDPADDRYSDYAPNRFAAWIEEADGFGTAIVLGCTMDDIWKVHHQQHHVNYDFDCGVVHDPEYYIKDGDVYHQLSVDTCAWVFGSPDNPYVKELTEGLELHP